MKRTLIPAVFATLLLAGCGSDSDGEDASDATGPITLFAIVPVDSQVSSLPFMKTSAQAAVDEINDAGGVQGRELEIEFCDDKFNADESLRCAQQAAQSQATAVVGSLTVYGAQVLPVLQQAEIAMVGADAVTPADATSDVSFLLDTGTLAYSGLPAVAANIGLSKVTPLDQDTSSAGTNLEYYKIGADAAGIDLTDQILLPADAVDYSTYVQQVSNKDGQAIVTAMSYEPMLKVFKAIETTGVDVPILGSLSSMRQDVIDKAGDVANGSWALSGIPEGDSSSEWGQQYLDAMAKYQPDEEVLGSLGFRAWASVHLFAEVAETIDGDITNESVLDAFNEVHDLQFMWIDSLSFDEPGPVEEYPRLVATTLYPFEVVDGKLTARDPFDPFEGS